MVEYQSYTWSFSDQGARPSQEDVVFQKKVTVTRENGNEKEVWIVGVADGHLGAEVSEFLKEYIPTAITPLIINKPPNTNDEYLDLEILKSEIIDIVKKADDLISQLDYISIHSCPGAVMSFYVVYGDHILVFQLGDTRILIFDENGECIFKTPLHDASNKPEVDRAKMHGGFVAANRFCGIFQPSRLIGDLSDKKNYPNVFLNEPEAFIIPLNQRMFIFSVTDGINTEDLTEFTTYVKLVANKEFCTSYRADKTTFLYRVVNSAIRDNKTISFQAFTTE